MGTYNPNAPTILGQEWTPIREEDLVLSPAVNAEEVGHGFTIVTSPILPLQEARFYINRQPPGGAFGQVYMASVYPRGTEDLSGPIGRVVIPCNSGTLNTGSAAATLVNATTVQQAVFDPSDEKSVQFLTDNSTVAIEFFFAVNQYAAVLTGKRILGVNILYSTTGFDAYYAACQEDGLEVPDAEFAVGRTTAGANVYFGNLESTEFHRVAVKPMGEVNHFWSTAFTVSTTSDRMPWNYLTLANFESTAANRHAVRFVKFSNSFLTVSLPMYINYVALEVIYCEEQRVAVGGRGFGEYPSQPAAATSYVPGANIIPMRSPSATGTVGTYRFTPGDYTVTIASADIGDLAAVDLTPIRTSTYPELNSLRELYPIPPHPGVLINRPFPVDETATNRIFSKETTRVLPQLSLHTSGGPFTEVHVYGRQSVAQVYGSFTATQEIFDPGATPQASYAQVRFYARRWGDTTVALTLSSTSPTVSGSSVSITPGEFDALLPTNGIIDGWKEVTLRFISAPVMGVSGSGGFFPQWKWSAAGELSGNRWEVLGAVAPAVSGIPANLLTLVPAPHQLGSATYGAPVSGAGINEGWMPGYAPLVSVTTDDPSADAVILFSQDPPPISGFGVTQLTQSLVLATANCPGFASGCVPTSMTYNRLTWTAQGLAMFDDFERFVANGWGVANPGGPWTVVSGTASNFSVNGSTGLISVPSVNVEQWINSASVGGPNVDLKMRVATSQVAATQPINIYLVARYVDLNNFYRCRLSFDVGGTLSLRFEKGVAGVFTSLGVLTPQPGVTHTVNTYYWFRFNITGNTLSTKVWQADSVEPSAWTIQLVDTDLTGPGTVGVRAILSSGNTNTLPVVYSINDFSSNLGYGSTELQRFDQVDGQFKTIMLSGSPATSGFSDYEARVGQQSVYRIRGVNIYDFAGLWSPQVTGTIPSPGVAGADTALLLFSSNEDPTKNLAYSSAWDSGDPQEDFQWPEAGDVILQEMYGKDFVTAFRPTERGGERFSRNILVNAAGIPSVTLANGFESLRDMAWADLPYVCVRDELGNRWFSTVLVPQGNRKRMKRAGHLDMASVSIIETTSTPSMVDPS